MESEKTMLYFRGKCYRNTRFNRFVMRFLTIFYNIRCLLCSFLIFLLLFCAFFSCSPSVKIESNNFHNDSIRCDSFEFAGHSYVEFQQLADHRFVVLHSPDCSCRYHRTFVVVKRNK